MGTGPSKRGTRDDLGVGGKEVIWLEFLLSSALIVVATIKLAEYGDVIAVCTRLGGMTIGTLLLAGATSLPELFTTMNSINQQVPDLAAGNIFNIFGLGSTDFFYSKVAFWQPSIRH